MLERTENLASLCILTSTTALLLVCAGCSTTSADRNASREIELDSFAATPLQPSIADDQSSLNSDGEPEPIVLGAGGSQSRGPEQLSDVADTTPKTDYVVESLVGQVNGRPIYADRFFADIEDRLIAIARRETPRRFQQLTSQIVEEHLRNIVQNELFLAEAESELSDREQMGLLAFMKDVQEQAISDRGGIESITRSRILSEEGITLDQYLELKKDETLIRKIVAERIAPRIIISWRDIQREYDRRFEEFNPPAHATLWRVFLSTKDDSEQIAEVTRRLEGGGESFIEVADAIGGRQAGEYGRFRLGKNGMADIELSEALKEKVVDLQEGDTAGPFEVGSRTWWLHVAEFDQPEPRPVYDPAVQRQLSQLLFQRRFEEEQMRFMESLLEDGIFDELTAMRNRLLEIALHRYSP